MIRNLIARHILRHPQPDPMMTDAQVAAVLAEFDGHLCRHRYDHGAACVVIGDYTAHVRPNGRLGWRAHVVHGGEVWIDDVTGCTLRDLRYRLAISAVAEAKRLRAFARLVRPEP